MKRTGVVLVVLAAAAGLAAGLYYSWVVAPAEEGDTRPGALRSADRALYLALIGDLYAYEGDLACAEARLSELGMAADGPMLAGFVETYLDGGGQPEEVRNLAHLAEALGARGGVLSVFAPAQATSAARPRASVPAAPPASATPIPTFQLVEKTALCAAPGRAGHITVWIEDAQGRPLAGIEIAVSWPEGQDRFYTGLRPEQGAGYADFAMTPGTIYEVYLADYRGNVAPELASDLESGLCPPGVEALDWRLVFQQSP